MKQKKLNSAVINAVNLSTAQSEYIDNAIGYQLQVIDMENIYNKDRASLTKLLVENVALALTDKPSYVEWNYIHGLIRESICKSTGMEFDSFDKNIWKNITDRLESDFDLVKPKSPNVKSEQKSEQRAKIDAMTDAELKAEGKIVELAKREEKRLKNADKLAKDSKKELSKKIKDNHNKLIENEFAFACWIDNNTNMLREQFLDSQS
jgi:hypothetical protein